MIESQSRLTFCKESEASVLMLMGGKDITSVLASRKAALDEREKALDEREKKAQLKLVTTTLFGDAPTIVLASPDPH
jgi:hypothetical protein